MRTGLLLFLAFLCLVTVASCTSRRRSARRDSGTVPVDAGPMVDTGFPRLDGGPGFDAGPRPDAGLPRDSGLRFDSGGPRDAGFPRDAGLGFDAMLPLGDGGLFMPCMSAMECPPGQECCILVPGFGFCGPSGSCAP